MQGRPRSGQPQLGPAPATEAADAKLTSSELLAAVQALARSGTLVEEGLLRRAVHFGPQPTRWYEPLAAAEGVDAWLLWWSCGGDIDLHDHGGAAGAIYVLEGRLLETYGTRRSRQLSRRTLQAGASIAFGPDYVHDIINSRPEPALSLHVYGPRLEAMTYYRLDDCSGRLLPNRSERVETAPEVA